MCEFCESVMGNTALSSEVVYSQKLDKHNTFRLRTTEKIAYLKGARLCGFCNIFIRLVYK